MGVRVAVVGAGYWGPNLIRNFASLPECKLVAVCDVNPDRLASIAEKYDVHTTPRLEEILAESSVEAVAVATPAESHRQIAEVCLRAEKHVFVEKPLAATSQDAKLLVQLAEEKGRILMVGHLFLYDPAINQLIDLVKDDAVGQIRYIYSIRTSMSGTARLDTNIIWDALIHDAYILPALLGRTPRRVLVIGQAYLSPGLEDVAFVNFDFDDGVLANIYVSWYALEKARRMTVIGSDAILVYDDTSKPKLTLYARRYERSDERDTRGRSRWYWRDEGSKVIQTDDIEPLRAECKHFIACISAGQRPKTDGRAGLEAVRVLEACQHSLELGGTWVEVV